MMGVFSEIDEFKAAQTALRQSEEMLREVLMHTAFAVYKRNLLTNHYEYVSPAFFEITGYDAGEVRGLPLENLLAMIHEDDVGGVVQAIEQQIQATGNVCDCLLEYRFRHKNGTYRWIQDQFRVLRSEQGHPLSLIGSVSDISLRKATEQVIRQTEKKFHDLFMQLPLPLSIVNSQSEIVFLNALFLHTFGYSPAEIPTLEAWRARAYPDPVRRQHAEEAWIVALQQFQEPGQQMQPVELLVTCKNGILRNVLVSGSLLDNNILLTYTDITELRRSEKLLHSAHARSQKNDLLNQWVQTSEPTAQMVCASQKLLGNRLDAPYVLCLVKATDTSSLSQEAWAHALGEKNLRLDEAVDWLEDEDRLAWQSKEGIGLILFGTKNDSKGGEERIESLQRRVAEFTTMHPELLFCIGIAETAQGVAQLRAAYRQAKIAVQTGPKRFPQLTVYRYRELGYFQILPCFAAEADSAEQPEVDAYIDRHLGALIRFDSKKNSRLRKTLEMILESDDLKNAAEKLFMHYQTVMYRKRQIEEVLGVSLDNPESRLTLQIAVKLLKLNRKNDD